MRRMQLNKKVSRVSSFSCKRGLQSHRQEPCHTLERVVCVSLIPCEIRHALSLIQHQCRRLRICASKTHACKITRVYTRNEVPDVIAWPHRAVLRKQIFFCLCATRVAPANEGQEKRTRGRGRCSCQLTRMASPPSEQRRGTLARRASRQARRSRRAGQGKNALLIPTCAFYLFQTHVYILYYLYALRGISTSIMIILRLSLSTNREEDQH